VDRFGVAEPVIQQIPPERILVQLPGLDAAKQLEARQTIERTAYLEFRLVHEDNDKLVAESQSDPRFVEPVGYKKLVHEDNRNGQPTKRFYFVKVRPEMTGKHVARAFVQYDDIGRPYVAMGFDPEGAAIFGRVTSANVGRQLAIVLDGELYSAPTIQDAIMGGNAQITGNFGGGGHEMLKSFDVNYLGTEKIDGIETAKLDLVPKSQKMKNNFPHITLWIDASRGVSLQQQLFETNGDYRLAKYSDIQINKKIPDSVFKLKTSSKTKILKH